MKLPKKRWIILGLILIPIIGFTTYSAVHEELPKVQTDKVLKKKLVSKVSASGKIQPVEEVEISAYVSAEVTKLYVQEGESVAKGDLLVELDSTRYKAGRDQAVAGLYSAQSRLKQAEAQLLQSNRAFERTQELFKKELVGKEALETAETTFLVNKAQVAAAKDMVNESMAALRLTKDELSKTAMKSPIDGVVSRLNKEVGEMAMGSQFTRDIIMTVADLSKMETVVEVDENDVVDIRIGNEAELEVDALPREKFKGRVTKIATSATVNALGTAEETTNFEVTVQVEDDVSKLRPGMSATADIIVSEKEDVLTLPIQCITMRDIERAMKQAAGEEVSSLRKNNDALKEVVFKVDGNTAHLSEVKTGISSDTEIEIESGVEEGQEVICGPYKTLHKEMAEGQSVEVDNTDSAGKEEEEK